MLFRMVIRSVTNHICTSTSRLSITCVYSVSLIKVLLLSKRNSRTKTNEQHLRHGTFGSRSASALFSSNGIKLCRTDTRRLGVLETVVSVTSNIPKMISNLERLCHDSSDLLRQIESRLGLYEQVGEDFVLNLEHEINEVVQKIAANLERMDILVNKETSSLRQHSKLRVDQIKYDFQHIQSAFRSLQKRREDRIREARQREELLAADFSKSRNGHTSITMDADLKHHTSLRNVNRNMDDLLSHGQEILGNLRDQRITLKGIKGRVLDIGTKLGLSTTVMKMIERRGAQDKYFFYGGMAFTLILMFAMYWYLA